MISFRKVLAVSMTVAVFAGACSSAAATQTTTVPNPAATATTAPVTSSSASVAASSSAAATTVMVMAIGGTNTLVGGANGMTLYTFDKDVADSGKSLCTAGCATKWPPLTVPSGTTPTAATGASGKLATIARDDGTTQVTYNGLPVYFYTGDTNAGDTTGNYPGWKSVPA